MASLKELIRLNIIEYLGRGIFHERHHQPCQDALGHKASENGNIILALSDGASSAEYAEQSAWENVWAVLDYFGEISLSNYVTLTKKEKKKDILHACMNRLKQLSKRVGCADPIEFSATLQFCVSDRKWMIIGHLGDGAIFCFDRDGYLLFSSEQENIIEENKTYFTVSDNAQEHLRLHTFSLDKMPIDTVLMASDGVCFMFENRGNGYSAQTAEEIVGYVKQKIIQTNTDLAEILDQMAEVPIERSDDWSVLIWSRTMKLLEEEKPTVVSMLGEEKNKYKKKNDINL